MEVVNCLPDWPENTNRDFRADAKKLLDEFDAQQMDAEPQAWIPEPDSNLGLEKGVG